MLKKRLKLMQDQQVKRASSRDGARGVDERFLPTPCVEDPPEKRLGYDSEGGGGGSSTAK